MVISLRAGYPEGCSTRGKKKTVRDLSRSLACRAAVTMATVRACTCARLLSHFVASAVNDSVLDSRFASKSPRD